MPKKLASIVVIEKSQLKEFVHLSELECIEIKDIKVEIGNLKTSLDTIQANPGHTIKLERGHSTSWGILDHKDNPGFGLNELDYENKVMINELIYPTPNCTDAFKDLIWYLAAEGFRLARARLIRLAPDSSMRFHIDEKMSFTGAWRVHVPIITNPDSTIEFRSEKFSETQCATKYHLKADGSVYLINVHKEHRAVNRSNLESRTHFVASLII